MVALVVVRAAIKSDFYNPNDTGLLPYTSRLSPFYITEEGIRVAVQHYSYTCSLFQAHNVAPRSPHKYSAATMCGDS